MRRLLAAPHNTSPNEGYDRLGKTPLHAAVQAGYIEIADLLRGGANHNAPWSEWYQLPLHLAVQNNDLAMVALLLDHGADPNLFWMCDGYSENPLKYTREMGYKEMEELLLARGADPERIRLHIGGVYYADGGEGERDV